MKTDGVRRAPGGDIASVQEGETLVIADDGTSKYRIVISESASPSERHAATELQIFLERICGVRLPIINDQERSGEHEIILGENDHLGELDINIDFSEVGDEGFIIRTVSPQLVIVGGRRRGTMYGVYAFLEEHLGCRWFTSEVSYIPSIPRLMVGPIDDVQVPALEYRDVFFLDSRDPDWAARNRVNGTWTLTEEHGGNVSFYPFGHSFWTLIPPDEFFESHPEWFPLIDGERTLSGKYVRRTQLCLTNEEMIDQAIEKVKEWIREHPEADMLSISQNDGRGGWCECEDCAALEEKEGGVHSAPIIYFVNRIAEAVAQDYPDIKIDTLAYSYSWNAPKTLKPLPNVVVRLVTGAYPRGEPACCNHPLGDEKCYVNADLRETISDWAGLTDNLYVWDYIVNFRQYLLPLPNIHTLGPNVRFFVENGVKGVFEQGSGDVGFSDMAFLKAYLVAKLLWNPEYDVGRGIEEFLVAYYGQAAEPIGNFLELLRGEVEGGDYYLLHVKLFDPSIDLPFLTPEFLSRARSLFEEAENRVSDHPEVLSRVRKAGLFLDYLKLRMAMRVMPLSGSEGGVLPVRDWYEETMESFFSKAEAAGVTHWRATCYKDSSMEDLRRKARSVLQLPEAGQKAGKQD